MIARWLKRNWPLLLVAYFVIEVSVHEWHRDWWRPMVDFAAAVAVVAVFSYFIWHVSRGKGEK